LSCPEHTVCIGPYVVGERPVPLEYQFQNSDGSARDITAYGVRFIWRERDGASTTRNGLLSATPTDGKVTYVWQGDEFPTPGHYRAEFWVGNGGTLKFASVLITWDVRAAVGPVPSI
jgi:hypothetical protein